MGARFKGNDTWIYQPYLISEKRPAPNQDDSWYQNALHHKVPISWDVAQFWNMNDQTHAVAPFEWCVGLFSTHRSGPITSVFKTRISAIHRTHIRRQWDESACQSNHRNRAKEKHAAERINGEPQGPRALFRPKQYCVHNSQPAQLRHRAAEANTIWSSVFVDAIDIYMSHHHTRHQTGHTIKTALTSIV